MTLKELKSALQDGERYKALVLAADPMVYLLQVVEPNQAEDDPPLTLQSARGENLVYRSQQAANQAFARAGVREVTLIHESAYGEMVGLPDADSNRLQVTHPIRVDDDL